MGEAPVVLECPPESDPKNPGMKANLGCQLMSLVLSGAKAVGQPLLSFLMGRALYGLRLRPQTAQG